MASAQPSAEEDQLISNPPALGVLGMIQDRYRRTKEHAEAFPYVWASYITVYGGFGLYMAYRWRKLRSLEDRIRILQRELKQKYEKEQAATSASSSADKISK